MTSLEQSQLPRAAAPVPGARHTPQTGQEHQVAGDDGSAVARARRPPTIEDEFLTVAEVAAILRLNQQTIRNWIQDSKLPSLRVGRRVRVLRRDLDQLIADAEEASRVDDRTPSAKGHRGEGRQAAEQFWGGA